MTRSPDTLSEAPTARADMYSGVHKSLRYMLLTALLEAGSNTWSRADSTKRLLVKVESALWACDRHITHEDTFIRPALLARGGQGAIETIDAEHDLHAEMAAELRSLVSALRRASSARACERAGVTLYLHFSVFVAETLAHGSVARANLHARRA